MQTIEFYISVDELPDYNEMGADPSTPRYDLYCMADVCKQTLEVANIELRDPVSGLSYDGAALSTRDEKVLIARAKEEAEYQFFGYVKMYRPKGPRVTATGTIGGQDE